MNDRKVKIFECLDTLVKMSRSKGNGASLIIEEDEIEKTIKEYNIEIEELNNSISLECYDASAEMADRNIEIITKKLIQQLRGKIKNLEKELSDIKNRESDYNSQITILRKNKFSHEEYVESLRLRYENADIEEIKDKYLTSISTTEDKIRNVTKELKSKDLEYKILQERLEEIANDLNKLNNNLKEKENLLSETQLNLKNKDSYLDQTKVNKIKTKIEEIESKKRKLNERIKEIHENTQYLLTKIKDDINSGKEASLIAKDIIKLVNKAIEIPYMNVDANKELEEELLKATQIRDSFALEIDQKNYSLLETLNPGKIRIDFLKNRIEKWTIEREEIKDKIFTIDNDQNYNYQNNYKQLNEILNTMKKELIEFEKAYENSDEINLTSKSSLKSSIEEKKREIFEAEKILSQFRHDESEDIIFANYLYTHEINELDKKIKKAEKEIAEIKENMISRKSGLIDITNQNRDKEKLKELAVKVIDIKHRRQFESKPIEIAEKIEHLLEIEIIPFVEIKEYDIEQEPENINIIIGESSIDSEIKLSNIEEINDYEEKQELTIEDIPILEETKNHLEEDENDIPLEIPPKRGIKVIEQIDIEDEEQDGDPEDPLESSIDIEESVITPIDNEDIVTLSNEDIEPDDIETSVHKIESNNEEPDMILTSIQTDQVPISEQELSINEMFNENASQKDQKNDNIVLDNELSVELDQYLEDLNLPN